MNIIELTDITFAYSDEEPVIFKNFNFSLEQGKCCVIEGENGAGKTTLFRILTGLSFPQKGSYTFDGQLITEKYLKDNSSSKLFHKRVGFLFQNPDVMLFNGRVYDEIAFGPRQMGLDEVEVRKRTEDCMDLFGLKDLSDKAPYHLSGGQKKKVALAAVMSLNPEVLILDEPFSGLDERGSVSLMNFLSELKSAGRTILISTHNPQVKEKIADEAIELSTQCQK